jgi:hypothetical protein
VVHDPSARQALVRGLNSGPGGAVLVIAETADSSGIGLQHERQQHSRKVRQKAYKCHQMARRAHNANIRPQLLALDDQWLALAKEIEKASTVIGLS